MEDRRSMPPYEDEFSRALLRSADGDEPSAAAYSKVAAALGVSAAGALASVSVPAQAALGSNGLSTASLAHFSGSLFGKAVIGLSSVLVVAGGVALLRAHEHAALAARKARASVPALARAGAPNITPEPTAQTASPAANEVANRPPSAAIASDAPSVPDRAGALASAEALPTPPPARSNNAAAPASNVAKSEFVAHAAGTRSGARSEKASTLPEQVSSLDRARVALDSGDSAGALAEIAHYRATWPRGVFLTEASVLEIEALAQRGQIVLAGMRAKAFVSAHPDSPQAERLRMLIPQGER
ncbi:MAG TPA: hypothetical protein VHV51_05040 [Polyangiaceae bacterium]|jgi:hypothetical protein|nr:hypothetical protein [Polyangiaceae bacterium]